MKIHIFHHPDKETAEQLCRLEDMLGECIERLTEMPIDTKAALAAVQQLSADCASLRDVLKQVKADLAAALAAHDPAAEAEAQADLQSITDIANTEDSAVKEAITPAA